MNVELKREHINFNQRVFVQQACSSLSTYHRIRFVFWLPSNFDCKTCVPMPSNQNNSIIFNLNSYLFVYWLTFHIVRFRVANDIGRIRQLFFFFFFFFERCELVNKRIFMASNVRSTYYRRPGQCETC